MGFLFGNKSKSNFGNMDIVTYRDEYANGKTQHTLIDVRTTSEYANGHLPNAINIPLNQIAQRQNEISKKYPIVIVCASGSRSRTASKALADAGFEGVYNLKGGTSSWMMAGLPTER